MYSQSTSEAHTEVEGTESLELEELENKSQLNNKQENNEAERLKQEYIVRPAHASKLIHKM